MKHTAKKFSSLHASSRLYKQRPLGKQTKITGYKNEEVEVCGHALHDHQFESHISYVGTGENLIHQSSGA